MDDANFPIIGASSLIQNSDTDRPFFSYDGGIIRGQILRDLGFGKRPDLFFYLISASGPLDSGPVSHDERAKRQRYGSYEAAHFAMMQELNRSAMLYGKAA